MVKELEKHKETDNILIPHFKCKICGANLRKKITLNKRYNTKHKEQSCKVCGIRS